MFVNKKHVHICRLSQKAEGRHHKVKRRSREKLNRETVRVILNSKNEGDKH